MLCSMENLIKIGLKSIYVVKKMNWRKEKLHEIYSKIEVTWNSFVTVNWLFHLKVIECCEHAVNGKHLTVQTCDIVYLSFEDAVVLL